MKANNNNATLTTEYINNNGCKIRVVKREWATCTLWYFDTLDKETGVPDGFDSRCVARDEMPQGWVKMLADNFYEKVG